jgi:hypothetical protein
MEARRRASSKPNFLLIDKRQDTKTSTIAGCALYANSIVPSEKEFIQQKQPCSRYTAILISLQLRRVTATASVGVWFELSIQKYLVLLDDQMMVRSLPWHPGFFKQASADAV